MAKLERFNCIEGESKSFSVTLTEAGDPLDLTGYSAVFRIGDKVSEAAVLEVEGTITDNVISFSISAAETVFAPGFYLCDCSITSAGGEVTYLFSVPWVQAGAINGD